MNQLTVPPMPKAKKRDHVDVVHDLMKESAKLRHLGNILYEAALELDVMDARIRSLEKRIEGMEVENDDRNMARGKQKV